MIAASNWWLRSANNGTNFRNVNNNGNANNNNANSTSGVALGFLRQIRQSRSNELECLREGVGSPPVMVNKHRDDQ